MAHEEQLSRGKLLGGAAVLGAAALGLKTRPARAGTRTAAWKATAKAKNAILIGAPLPLTGGAAGDGVDAKSGIQLAVKEINESGGIAGRMLKVSMTDVDIFTPEGVSSAFNKLVGQRVDAICLPYVLAPAPSYDIVAPYGCPYLHGITQQAMVDQTAKNRAKYGMIFNVDPTEVWYGRGFIPFINSLVASGRWKPSNHNIHILQGTAPFSVLISQELQAAAKKSGKWKVVEVTSVIPPVNDWGPILSKVHKTKPGVIFNTHWVPAEIAAQMKQFVADPTNSLLYLHYAPSIPQFLQLAGKAANGAIWSTVSGTYKDPIGLAFRQRFQKFAGRAPGFTYAGMCYDQVHMLARAWAMVGDPRNFKAVVQQLHTMIHRGVNGGYYLNNQGNVGMPYPDSTPDPSLGQGHLYLQIQGGQHKIISPAPYIESRFKPAAWQH